MNINESSFPLVKTLAYDSNTPSKIKLNTLNTVVQKKHPRAIDRVDENLSYIQAKNQLAGRSLHQNYWVDQQLLTKIEQDEVFRKQQYVSFNSSALPSSSGTLLHEPRWQTVYLLLDHDETWGLKRFNGVYLGVASFDKDHLLAFEEGIFMDNGIKLTDISYYSSNMTAGSLLAAITTFLAYLQHQTKPILLDHHFNSTTQDIYYVD